MYLSLESSCDVVNVFWQQDGFDLCSMVLLYVENIKGRTFNYGTEMGNAHTLKLNV